MKILFSNPRWWEKETNGKWMAGIRAGSRWPFTMEVNSKPDQYVHGDYLPYPFFMAYATTYLAEKTEREVAFRDSIALRESYETFFQHLYLGNYDFIFIEIATPSWEHDCVLIQDIKKTFPTLKIVITGPIVLSHAEELLNKFGVHACIKGEYEKGSVRVVQGESGVIDYDMLSEEEMNKAPYPYMDEVYVHRYFDANPVGQQWPHAQVWSSRGCPYKCIFCVWPATMTGNDPDGTERRTVRHYNAGYMYFYLKSLVDRFNIKSVYFDDDTFNLGDKHVLAMCGVMEQLQLPWSAMCRADTITLSVWKDMKASGCFGVKIGFESGSQRVIDKIINKRLDLKQAAAVTKHLLELGLTVHGTFTYGLPGETEEEMRETKAYIQSLNLTSYQESGTAEIEGTPLHTLRIAGTLEKYQDASVQHENYTVGTDGQQKMREIEKKVGR